MTMPAGPGLQRMDVEAAAERLLEGPVRDVGFELVACEFTTVRGRPTLRLYVDAERGVGIEDCVRVHDAVTDLLDVEDLVAASYDLEVSSPGLERPLRRVEHFLRHVGDEARVRTREPIEGRRNFTGRITGVSDGIVQLDDGNRSHEIPVAGIDKAHLKADWSRLFSRDPGPAGSGQ